MHNRLLYFIAISCLVPSLSLAQTSDTTPPSLGSLTISPGAINTIAGSQNVTVTAVVTDDLSGVPAFGVNVVFTSPSTNQRQFFGLSQIGGSSLNGTFQAVFSFPQFTESGSWSLSVGLQDNAGNVSTLTPAALQGLGFPHTLAVTSTPDTQPPQVTSFSFSPSSLDVSAAARTTTLSLGLTDNLSGASFTPTPNLGFFTVTMQSPSGDQHEFLYHNQFTLKSGTPLSGVWQATLTIPQYSEPGAWTILTLVLTDAAGNNVSLSGATLLSQGISTVLNVTSSPADTTPPTLTGLSFSPAFVDTSLGPQTVTVTMDLADNLSGVDFSFDTPNASFSDGVEFQSPSRQQSAGAFLNFGLVSGTALSGAWQGTLQLPQFSEAGTWTLTEALFKDKVHNTPPGSPYAADGLVVLTTPQLQALNVPVNLTVIKPSLTTDGTAGGSASTTVTDQTFGARAQITVPPNVLPANSQVAIDVFQTPLQVPIPTGFSASGTLFVNIEVTPTPPNPLPAPGVTLTLPLAHQMQPGDPVDLFSVDPNTGTLVRVLNTSGAPVVGTVDAGGFSATFVGVSHLSTFVGLLPVSLDVNGVPPNVTRANTSDCPGPCLFGAIDAGWVFTPTTTMTIHSIETWFSSAANWIQLGPNPSKVTVEIYQGIPVNGGFLLRSANFTPLGGAYSGPANLGTDLTLQAGTQYFIGFFNIQGLGTNEMFNGTTKLQRYYQGAPDAAHMYYETYDSTYPALRFLGQP